MKIHPKSWKRKMAAVMACVLMLNTTGIQSVFAAEENINEEVILSPEEMEEETAEEIAVEESSEEEDINKKIAEYEDNSKMLLVNKDKQREYLQGEGTIEKPYEIFSYDDLNLINEYSDKYFILSNDIDCKNNEFAPLCPEKGFSGYFDGNGYSIKNVSINADSLKSVGLFAIVAKNGVVENLMLDNISIRVSEAAAGGIAGYNYGKIRDCYVKSNISGAAPSVFAYENMYVLGGIAGYSSGKISNCISVTSNSDSYDIRGGFSGGITGMNKGDISICFSSCKVKGYAQDNGVAIAGGITGKNKGNISFCKVQSEEISSDVSVGGAAAGGIAGANLANGNIKKTYFIGTVSSYARTTYYGSKKGGIVGSNGDRWLGTGGNIINSVAVDVSGGILPISGGNNGGVISDNYTNDADGIDIISQLEEKLKICVWYGEKKSIFFITPQINSPSDEKIEIYGTLRLINDVISDEISTIKWTSSDQDIVQDSEISCIGVNSYDNRSVKLTISFTPHKEGKVTITGTTLNGLTKSCEVTIENTALPIDDNIASFTLPRTRTDSIGKTGVIFSGKISLKDGETISAERWNQIINSIAWTSSNPSVIEEIKCSPVVDSLNDTDNVMFFVSATPNSIGTATIIGTLPNGMTQSCEVTVTERKDYSDAKKRHITGTLKSVNTTLSTVVIDNTEYAATSVFDISEAQKILDGDCQTVVAVLADNEVLQMDCVTDIVQPDIRVFAESGLTYKKGSFGSSSMKLSVELYCGIKSPYNEIDIKGTEAETMGIQFTGYTLEVPADSPLSFKGNQKTTSAVLDYSMKLNDGGRKEEIPIYIDKNYVPQKVNETLSLDATVMSRSAKNKGIGLIYIYNQDLQDALSKAAQESKEQQKEIEKTQKELNDLGNTTIAFNDELLSRYYNPATVRKIRESVSAWLSSIFVTVALPEEKSLMEELQKKFGLTKEDITKNIIKKTLKELGVQLPDLTTADVNTKNIKSASVMIEARSDIGTERGKILKIHFYLKDMNLWDLNNSASFGGMGTISYSVIDSTGNEHTPSLGKEGIVTYAALTPLVESMKSVAMSSIEKVYKEAFGNNMDKLASALRVQVNNDATNIFVQVLTSALMEKLLKKGGITFSKTVFKIGLKELENTYSQYDVYCPVDIYVYDDNGELCGSIVSNQIAEDKNKIGMSVTGDAKHIYLSNDDYIIKYVGNDIGSMHLIMITYADDEAVRTAEYKEIPLEAGLTYYSIVPDTIYMDNTVTSPIAVETGKVILPDSDSWQDANVPTPDISPIPGGDEEETPTPQPGQKLAQSLNLKYGLNFSRTVGSKLTQDVSGAYTQITFTSSNPKVAKINKTTGKITCVGVGTAVITAKAAESSQYKAASKKVTITVIPKNAGIKSVASKKKGQVIVKSTNKAKGNTGYQLQYKHNGKTKTIKVLTGKTLTKTIKGLKSGKSFKVRIRAYKKTGGKTYFGNYSKWKTLKKVR